MKKSSKNRTNVESPKPEPRSVRDRIGKLYGGRKTKTDEKDLASVPDSGVNLEPESATNTASERIRTMQLTFKGLSKSGKYALYSGLRTVSRLSVTDFPDSQPPATLEITGELAGPRVKMTAEERKAARKNAPKPTLAEQIAKREKALAKLRAKAEAEAVPA